MNQKEKSTEHKSVRPHWILYEVEVENFKFYKVLNLALWAPIKLRNRFLSGSRILHLFDLLLGRAWGQSLGEELEGK